MASGSTLVHVVSNTGLVVDGAALDLITAAAKVVFMVLTSEVPCTP